MGNQLATREQAEAVLQFVQEAWPEKIEIGPRPQIFEPGHEGDFWVVSWEEGPEGWALDVSRRARIPGTFTEPVYSWCLAVHPDE